MQAIHIYARHRYKNGMTKPVTFVYLRWGGSPDIRLQDQNIVFTYHYDVLFVCLFVFCLFFFLFVFFCENVY